MADHSGRIEQGSFTDPAEPRITAPRFVCLRAASSGGAGSPDAAVSSRALYVFDSPDAFHGYFASTEQNRDESLLRERLLVSRIKDVHVLSDGRTGKKAIELELDDAGADSSPGAPCLWMLEAANEHEHNLWARSLRAAVAQETARQQAAAVAGD